MGTEPMGEGRGERERKQIGTVVVGISNSVFHRYYSSEHRACSPLISVFCLSAVLVFDLVHSSSS